MGQTVSMLLSVERGLPEKEVIVWIEESLKGVVGYQSSRMPFLENYPSREAIYAQVAIPDDWGVSEHALRTHLANPPQAIQLIQLSTDFAQFRLSDRLYLNYL